MWETKTENKYLKKTEESVQVINKSTSLFWSIMWAPEQQCWQRPGLLNSHPSPKFHLTALRVPCCRRNYDKQDFRNHLQHLIFSLYQFNTCHSFHFTMFLSCLFLYFSVIVSFLIISLAYTTISLPWIPCLHSLISHNISRTIFQENRIAWVKIRVLALSG